MNDTPYYKARMRASEKDAAFESRLSTSAVMIMAKEYDAPELVEYYCQHVCAISAYCKSKRGEH